MKYCAKCGQCLSDNCDFCPVCGHDSFADSQENPYDAEKYSHSEMRFSYKKPKATFFIIAVNLVVFLFVTLLKFKGSDLVSLLSMHRGAVSEGQFYRVITSLFTHEALFHFLSNNYALYIYGSILEPALGKGKFLFIYFASGILGNLLTYALIPNPSIGASGAIFGLLGAIVAIYFINPTAVNRAMMRGVVSCVVITTIYSFTGGINNIAHFGGLFGGYMALCAITSLRVRKKFLTERGLMAALLVVIMALSVTVGSKKELSAFERQYGNHAVMSVLAFFNDYEKADYFAEMIISDEKNFYSMDAFAVSIIDNLREGDRESAKKENIEFLRLFEQGYSMTDRNIYEDFMKFSFFEKEESVEG